MATKAQLNIRFDRELLVELDVEVGRLGMTRTRFLEGVVRARLAQGSSDAGEAAVSGLSESGGVEAVPVEVAKPAPAYRSRVVRGSPSPSLERFRS